MGYHDQIRRDDLIVAAALVRSIEVKPSGPVLKGLLDELYSDLGSGRAGGDDARRGHVREVLRNGRYRPSGRGKPAQEYLRRVFDRQGHEALRQECPEALLEAPTIFRRERPAG